MTTRLLPPAALVLGACLVALGPVASASADTSQTCRDGAADATFDYTLSGGIAEVTVDRAGCTPERTYHVSSYTLDRSEENASTEVASNPYAFPQTLFAHGVDIRIPKGYVARGTTWTSTVNLPRCGDYQEDLYSGEVLDRVDAGGHPGFVAGAIVLQAECTPATTVTSAPPVTTEPTTSSTTVSSTSTSSTSASTTSASTTSGTTTSATTTDTLPATTTTGTSTTPPTTDAATVAPSSVSTSTQAAPPITSVKAAGVPLAMTGPGGTTSLVAAAAGLVIVGIGAVAVTRRARIRGSHGG